MFQIFIVFHKFIFDDCYKKIPKEILNKYFTFVAVNEKIPKTYTLNKYNVINEWELPNYDPTFQERGYNENSVIYHIYYNNLHKNYKYIGFFQYDMHFGDNLIDFLQKNITKTPQYFTIGDYDFDYCSFTTWNEPITLNYIIDDYENFFNKPFNKKIKYPLLNTYIIPVETYEKIMKWVIQLYDKLYPWSVEPPNMSYFGRIGGIYERIMAYAIGNEFSTCIYLTWVKHDHEYKKLSY